MKKILALILVMLMILGSFASCGGVEPTETEKQTEKQTQEDDEGTEDGTEDGTDEETDKESDKGTDESETCTEHVDADKNHACDKCKAEVGTHTDGANDGDHVCDYGCGATLTTCEDSDKNHKCDDCQANMGAHEDSTTDNDHLCDYGCGVTVTSCADDDKNHKCDTCEIAVGAHADSANDGDHVCDYGCRATLTECVDSNSDGNCDECGALPYTREGKKITFGSYPQTKVTDETLLATLNSQIGALPTSHNSQSWTSYGYYVGGEEKNFMWYIDITVGNDKYRGVYFTSYRSVSAYNGYESRQHANGYIKNEVYWFKYEPISWTILSENTDKKTVFILCDMIIDSQAYQNEYEYDSDLRECVNTSENVPEGTYANNYEYSTIRKWLNETFYNTAFDALQKAMIVTTTVDNSTASTLDSTNKYTCNDTKDNIFLLSYKEVDNESYGFVKTAGSIPISLSQKTPTDYAKSQDGDTLWRLRFTDENGSFSCCISDIGKMYGGYVELYNPCGIVPALCVGIEVLS